MKSFISIQPSIILISLVFLTISSQISAQRCMDHPDPFNFANNVNVDCKSVSEPTVVKRANQDNNNVKGENMFRISRFQCESNITGLCDNVKNSFETAGQMISQVFCLKAPVLINVTFLDFCTGLGVCPGEQFVAIGVARPVRSILMQDDDGVTRFYPQALVKQYQLSTHPEYAPSDITATFNSRVKWWFREEKRPIKDLERDFLFVVVHEMMHGLGFQSYWSDWTNPYNASEALSPYPLLSNDPEGGESVIFDGFQEYCFDKYIITLPSGQRMSDINVLLNKFAGGPGTKFANVTDFILQFHASPQYELAKKIFKKAITADSLGFLPQGLSNPNDSVILETSLNPYTQGSNIEHVSLTHYANSTDFLMKFLFNPLETLESLEKKAGSECLGAIGPELRLIMQSLGYVTAANPFPYRPTPPRPVTYPLTDTIDG